MVESIMSSNVTAKSATVGSTVWCAGQHCPELDGVRGLAILMVTLYRFMKEVDPTAHPILAIVHRFAPIGERGVDLFFVLSGFLITGILLQTKSRDGYFRKFFIRRSLRIFPLYFSALIFCLWIIPSFYSPTPFDKPRAEQVYLWTYMTNVRMSWLNEWSFGPLDHFWSLAVEEHFYLVWPFVVFFLSNKLLLRLSVAIIILVGIARMIASTHREFDVAVDVLTVFRCDSLCFGALLAVILASAVEPKRIEVVARWTLPPLTLSLIGIVAIGSRLGTLPSSLCPAFWMIALAILLSRPPTHWLSKIARVGFLSWLGKYSYGMYVVQLPLVSLLTTQMVTGFLANVIPSPLVVFLAYILFMFVMTMVLGYLSFHLLEKHFLKLKPKWS
ncbi:MAG: acyltransferase [Planctomycetota bacterium]|nr:acyltransferase [Planctomycetota bacterium]